MDFSSSLYKTVRFFGRPLRFRVDGLDHYASGAAVFVANHLGSAGPVRLVFSTSIRFYPWVIADMLDLKSAPGYLLKDFIEPELHLKGVPGKTVAWLVSRAAVHLLNGVGCIPVDRHNPWSTTAFRQSLQHLLEDQVLLIFPEDPDAAPQPGTHLRPFQQGFPAIGQMYARTAGKGLPFLPTAVVPERQLIRIGEPRYLEADSNGLEAVRAFAGDLEAEISRMYLDILKGKS